MLHVNKRDAAALLWCISCVIPAFCCLPLQHNACSRFPKGWKSNLFLEEKPVSLIAMTKAS